MEEERKKDSERKKTAWEGLQVAAGGTSFIKVKLITLVKFFPSLLRLIINDHRNDPCLAQTRRASQRTPRPGTDFVSVSRLVF